MGMCFSVEVITDLKKIMERFHCQLDLEEEKKFNSLLAQTNDVGWAKEFLSLNRKPPSNPFKLPNEDGRIFPGYFSYVMVDRDLQRTLIPMRYRLRPAQSQEEIPAKFNVFNARYDSLMVRPTWKSLYMKKHGIFPFKRFFEWVEDGGKKRLISFHSDHHEMLWAPCLWDHWKNEKTGQGFYSFAIITDDPPQEVARMGHDRCPIFLKEEAIDEWLNPAQSSRDQIGRLLKARENVLYRYQWGE
jgi:putative SOS response-associated peptidase YedK